MNYLLEFPYSRIEAERSIRHLSRKGQEEIDLEKVISILWAHHSIKITKFKDVNCKIS